MWTLLLSLALAAASSPNVSTDQDADVVASKVIAAPPEALYARLLDLKQIKAISEDACVSRWVFGPITSGVGASASMRYHAGAMHRRLTMTLTKVDENRRITLDHAGKKGFITTWDFAAQDAGTNVEFHTWLSIPPWPFRKYYFKKVQPAWVACQQAALQNLAQTTPAQTTPAQ